MTQEERDEIVDSIPKRFEIVEHDEELGGPGGTLESWGETLGHELNDSGQCLTCGRGTTCTFKAFYEALIASVVRELDELGRLSPSGVRVVSKTVGKAAQAVSEGLGGLFRRLGPPPADTRGPVTWCQHDADRHGPEVGCVECMCLDPQGHETPSGIDRMRNDPYDLWGDKPSYRCFMTRHRECEPEGADTGCTCQCGHQDPVCACGTRETYQDGRLIHYEGCPEIEPRSVFQRDHEEDMKDPEYRQAFEVTSEELRKEQSE